MNKRSSLIFILVLMFSAELRAEKRAVKIPQKIEISRTPLGTLIEQGGFDIVNVEPALDAQEDRGYGQIELFLIDFGRRFPSPRAVIAEIRALGLAPASYRDLLEYARTTRRSNAVPWRIVALGTPIKRPGGLFEWQACGVNRSRQRFLERVPQYQEQPPDSFYLAKLPPMEVAERADGERWREMQRVAAAVEAEIAAYRRRGVDPDAFYLRVKTFLSYRDIVIAAYHKAQTLAGAQNMAELPGTLVLAKALYERNIVPGDDLRDRTCLLQSCKDRTVEIVLTAKGLEIVDIPNLRTVHYDFRLILSD